MNKYIRFSIIFSVSGLFISSVFSLPLNIEVSTYTHDCYLEYTFTLKTDHKEIGNIKCICLNRESTISSLYVKEQYRKNGYGSILLRFSMDYLIELGIKKFSLSVYPFEYCPDNAVEFLEKGTQEYTTRCSHLIKFYQTFGFRVENDTASTFLTYTQPK